MATSGNAELLALSGRRSPTPDGLGVIEQDALADRLLVGGGPIEDLSVMAEPGKDLRLIMKDCRIHKNAL